MPAVCLYFQVHQPPRLRTFNVFEPTPHYFDNDRNRQILQRVTHKCYLPATDLLAKLIRVHQGRFRVAFCLTGSVVEQMRQWEPALVERFRSLADTGCVEFLNETYHHSLASVYDLNEFREQVAMHRQMVEELFGYTPTVFRNTELIYDNRLAETITSLEFETVRDRPLAEIWDNGAAFKAYRGTDWMQDPCRSCDRLQKER